MKEALNVTLLGVAMAITAVFGTAAAPVPDGATAAREAEVSTILEQYPGGTEIAPGVIAWDGGATILTLESSPANRSVGTCATGQYCAWSNTSYTGTKLSFTTCAAGGTSSSLALLGGSVRSTANARTSGTVKAVNGGSVAYTMSADTGVASNSAALTHLVCNP